MAQESLEQRRKNSPYWQVLRKDLPSALAIYLVLLATIFMGVAFLGLLNFDTIYPYFSPSFWVLAIVAYIWWNYLAKYRPLSVVIFKVMMMAIIPVMIAATVTAYAMGVKDMTSLYFLTSLCSAFNIIAIFFYSKSVLRKQGPFR